MLKEITMHTIKVTYSTYRDLIKLFKFLAQIGGTYSDADGRTVMLHVPEKELAATYEFLNS